MQREGMKFVGDSRIKASDRTPNKLKIIPNIQVKPKLSGRISY